MKRQNMEEEVREICSLSAIFTSCLHLSSNARKHPAFVDWYLILRVDEDSRLDVIRRRYRQLALQLHPDKNRHPNAEVAFKLISEAYECLSDEKRRRAFDTNRRNRFCEECYLKFKHRKSDKNHRADSSHRVLRAFKEVQNRFREECIVIESCLLRANRETFGKESPVFDPTDRMLFPGYPHFRTHAGADRRHESYCYFGGSAERWSHRKFGCESPVYQFGSEGRQRWSCGPDRNL